MAMRNLTMDQLIDRAQAQTVACQHCGAKVGETCMRTDFHTGQRTPVENFPAHHSRLKRAERTAALAAQADCPHASFSGDEGPVPTAGTMPTRWTCDQCGLIKWENR